MVVDYFCAYRCLVFKFIFYKIFDENFDYFDA